MRLNEWHKNKKIVWAAGGFCMCAIQACTSYHPVVNAKDAITIAQEVCEGKADRDANWYAELDQTKTVWLTDTGRDICAKRSNRMWGVEIPVNGPRPTECRPVLHSLMICELEINDE
ncbi:MAG: hypothetical protein DHS20C05_19870 [Hyphococcus sp.]|nr:MAG: hypothetical protein DHS20C05_19870 [Marinicaulis sp.]